MAPAFTRNLLLFHTEGHQSLDDWRHVERAIAERAPDIDVKIAANHFGDSTMLEVWQSSRPSLVFSPMPLRGYQPRSGTVFAGDSDIGKDEQIARLTQAGIPVPPTFTSAPARPEDRAALGAFAIMKPSNRGKGIGIRLVRTESITHVPRGYLVQPYIDHAQDNRPTEYRVLTLFGRALYCTRNQWAGEMEPVDRIADRDGVIASNAGDAGARLRQVVDDEEVIALAERTGAACPDRALLGIDIIRERGTGRLYVLELNPGGRVWHFSSDNSRSYSRDHVAAMYRQFGGMDRVASILIEKTRELAR